MREVWKDIVGFPGYRVSNLGRVLSNRRGVPRFLKFKINVSGYFVLTLYSDTIPRYFFVHRLVAFAFIKTSLKRKYINHKNGNKRDNSVSNLEWVTGKENQQHALKVLKISWSRKGERSNWAKLNSKQVLIIRKLAEKKINYGTIAKRFGISKPLITLIKQRKTWAHL